MTLLGPGSLLSQTTQALTPHLSPPAWAGGWPPAPHRAGPSGDPSTSLGDPSFRPGPSALQATGSATQAPCLPLRGLCPQPPSWVLLPEAMEWVSCRMLLYCTPWLPCGGSLPSPGCWFCLLCSLAGLTPGPGVPPSSCGTTDAFTSPSPTVGLAQAKANQLVTMQMLPRGALGPYPCLLAMPPPSARLGPGLAGRPPLACHPSLINLCHSQPACLLLRLCWGCSRCCPLTPGCNSGIQWRPPNLPVWPLQGMLGCAWVSWPGPPTRCSSQGP